MFPRMDRPELCTWPSIDAALSDAEIVGMVARWQCARALAGSVGRRAVAPVPEKPSTLRKLDIHAGLFHIKAYAATLIHMPPYLILGFTLGEGTQHWKSDNSENDRGSHEARRANLRYHIDLDFYRFEKGTGSSGSRAAKSKSGISSLTMPCIVTRRQGLSRDTVCSP